MLQLKLMPARRNSVITAVRFTGSRLPMMKGLSDLMLSRGRTRILLMRSRISLTNWVMVDVPFMSFPSNVAALMLKRKSFKLLLRNLKLLLSKKKIRFSELNLSLDKSARRLIVAFKRRRRSFRTLEKTMKVPWDLCRLLWRLNNVRRVKPFVSKRNLNLTSMSLKLPLTMPTKQMLKD